MHPAFTYTGCSDVDRKKVKLKQADINNLDEVEEKLTVKCNVYVFKCFKKSWRDYIRVSIVVLLP